MANTEQIITKVFLDVASAKKNISDLQQQYTKLEQKRKEALAAGDMKGYKQAEKQMRSVNNELKAMASTSQQVNKVLNFLSSTKEKCQL